MGPTNRLLMSADRLRVEKGACETMEADLLDRGVVVARVEGAVARVTFNRHEKRNSINAAVADAFCSIVDEITDQGVTVGILAARGTSFCAGVDLSEPHVSSGAAPFVRLLEKLRAGRQIWIAEVQGGAVGAGVAVALSCPIVVMSRDAWLWLPELSKTGRFPTGVLRWLSPVLGPSSAFGLAVTERKVDAEEALASGWVSAVHPPEELASAAERFAQHLAQADAGSLRSAAEHWALSAVPSSLHAANERG